MRNTNLMIILQTNHFKKTIKKFFPEQKKMLDGVIKKIAKDTTIGELKKGDLSNVRVHKFKIQTQLFLLAYTYDVKNDTLSLLALGPHENFYRDLKYH